VCSGKHVVCILHALRHRVAHGNTVVCRAQRACAAPGPAASSEADRQLEAGRAQAGSFEDDLEPIDATRLVVVGETVHTHAATGGVRWRVEVTGVTGGFIEPARMRERRPTPVGRRHDEQR
jgi:hypothetical protein